MTLTGRNLLLASSVLVAMTTSAHAQTATSTDITTDTTAHLGWAALDPNGSSYHVAEGATLTGLSGQKQYHTTVNDLSAPMPDIAGVDPATVAKIFDGNADNGAVSLGNKSSLSVDGKIYEDSQSWADRGLWNEIETNGTYGKNTYANTVDAGSDNMITVSKTGSIVTSGASGAEAINLIGTGNVVDNSGLIHADNYTGSKWNTDGSVNNGAAAIWLQNQTGVNTIINRAGAEISTDAVGPGSWSGISIGLQPGGAADITNAGKILGFIKFQDGDDRMEVDTGSTYSDNAGGKVLDGEAGKNSFVFGGDTGTDEVSQYDLRNWQSVTKGGTGTWTASKDLLVSSDSATDEDPNTGREAVGSAMASDWTVKNGKLVLLTDNAGFSGTGSTMTVADKGTLALGDGTTTNGSLSGTIKNSGLVTMDHAGDWTYGTDDQHITGTGAVDVQSTTALEGTQDYTGTTTVEQEARADVGGDYSSSPFDVKGTVAEHGNGVVGSTHIENGGVLDATGSKQTFEIAGNYTADAGSILRISGTGAEGSNNGGDANLASNLVHATGTATLNGGVVDFTVSGNSLMNVGNIYTLVSADKGVTGAYSELSTNVSAKDSWYKPVLDYTMKDYVRIVLVKNGDMNDNGGSGNQSNTGGAVTPTNPVTPVTPVTPTNPDNNSQANTGGDNSGSSTDNNTTPVTPVQPVVTATALETALVNLPKSETNKALNQVDGEIHSSVKTAMVQAQLQYSDAAVDRLRSSYCDPAIAGTAKLADANGRRKEAGACVETRTVFWGQAYGSWSNFSGNGNAGGLNSRSAGFILGADTLIADTGWRIGGLAAYGHDSFSLRDGRYSSGHSNDITFGVYGGKEWQHWGFRTGAFYTVNLIGTDKNVNFANFTDRNSSRSIGGTVSAFGDLGYKFHAGLNVIEPFVNATYVNASTDRYHENGGSAALSGKDSSMGVTFFTSGVRFNHKVKAGNWTLYPHEMLGYRHAFGDLNPYTRQAFIDGGNGDFGITGASMFSDAALANVGLTAKVTDSADLTLDWTGAYGSSYTSNGVRAKFRIKF